MKSVFIQISAVVFAVCLLLASAVGPLAAAVSNPDLKNITLANEADSSRPFHLVDGRLSGDHVEIRVLKSAAGDFNHDGNTDGVVITFENYGGSGNFRVLNLLLNRRGKLVNTDRVQLGDRITVKKLRINKPGKIAVDFLDRSPDAPMAGKPTLKKSLVFRVEKDKLVAVKKVDRVKK